MKATPKTDKYIQSLTDVLLALELDCYEYPCCQTSATLFERLKRAQFKSMLLAGQLTLGDVKDDEAVDNIMKMFDYPENDRPMIRQVVVYENECFADIKRELLESIPEIGQAREYIGLFKRKFNGVWFPNAPGIHFSTLETNPYRIALNKLVEEGTVAESDVYPLLTHIGHTMSNTHSLYVRLRALFEEIVPGCNSAQQDCGQELSTPQLNTKLTDTQRERLFNGLLGGGFMAANTDRASFLWAFGGSVPPTEFKQLKWLKTDASLVYLIYELCNGSLGVNNHWVVGQEIFGVMNMAKKRERYYNNKNGKPNGSEVIDGILSRTKGGQ